VCLIKFNGYINTLAADAESVFGTFTVNAVYWFPGNVHIATRQRSCIFFFVNLSLKVHTTARIPLASKEKVVIVT